MILDARVRVSQNSYSSGRSSLRPLADPSSSRLSLLGARSVSDLFRARTESSSEQHLRVSPGGVDRTELMNVRATIARDNLRKSRTISRGARNARGWKWALGLLSSETIPTFQLLQRGSFLPLPARRVRDAHEIHARVRRVFYVSQTKIPFSVGRSINTAGRCGLRLDTGLRRIEFSPSTVSAHPCASLR